MKVISASPSKLSVNGFDLINSDEQNLLQFRLIPMIHIGEANFYKSATNALGDCQHLIFEGVKLNKLRSFGRITKQIAKKLELVEQRNQMRLKELPLKLIHGDLDEEEASKAWQKVNRWERLSVRYMYPLLYHRNRRHLSRRMMARVLANSQEARYSYRYAMYPIDSADFFISEFRERKLFKTINRHIKEQKDTTSITGILYGAGHAKAILAHLEQWGYSIQNAFPLTVFNIK